MSGAPIDIGRLVGMLADRIEALCAELLPLGRREGPEWVDAHSNKGGLGDSMKVHLVGDRRGIWAYFGGAPTDRGDALDLIAFVLFRGNKGDAIRWSRRWLGLDAGGVLPEPHRRAAAPKPVREKAEPTAEDRRRQAMAIFLGARERLAGTPVDHYLKGRALDLAQLGRQPRALRYHPELMHPETGEFAPAMVAAISSPDGAMLGVHRTWLEAHPDGRVTKLTGVTDAKRTLGRYAGGCIHLWRGASGKTWRDAVAGEWVVIGEGIEDTLTAVLHAPEYRAAVAVSGSNLAHLVLPPAIEGVILLGQHDPEEDPRHPGKPHPARIARDKAIENFQRQGKRVRLALPPPGTKDVNELAQRAQGG